MYVCMYVCMEGREARAPWNRLPAESGPTRLTLPEPPFGKSQKCPSTLTWRGRLNQKSYFMSGKSGLRLN